MSKRTLFPVLVTIGIVSRVAAQEAPHPIVQQNTQTLMQSNSGSLLLASLPDRVSSNDKPPAYSLIAVSEPQPKLLKKHDLITIIVQEVSQSESKGTSDLQKAADFDAKVDQWISLKLSAMSLHGTGQA